MTEIGVNLVHPKVSYIRASAEMMPLPDDEFDLVYTFTTLEHIPDIASALREMVRVCRPGGGLYSVALPLWNCRSGPHWG